jgi:hypothetical protein
MFSNTGAHWKHLGDFKEKKVCPGLILRESNLITTEHSLGIWSFYISPRCNDFTFPKRSFV